MSDLAGRTPAHSSRDAQVSLAGTGFRPAAAGGGRGVWLVAAVAQTAAEGLEDPRIAIAFGALIALGEVLRLNLPGDRETAPIGFAARSPTPCSSTSARSSSSTAPSRW